MNQFNKGKINRLENAMISIKISGQVEPYAKLLSEESGSEYKLVDDQGYEYFLEASAEMKKDLARYIWKDVKIVGLLNRSEMILIPQKILPPDSRAGIDNMIDLDSHRRKKILKTIAKKINDFVIIPLGVLAVLAS